MSLGEVTHYPTLTVDSNRSLPDLLRLAGITHPCRYITEQAFPPAAGEYEVQLVTYESTGRRGVSRSTQDLAKLGYELVADLYAYLTFLGAHPESVDLQHVVAGLPRTDEPYFSFSKALSAFRRDVHFGVLEPMLSDGGLVGTCLFLARAA